MQCLLGRLTLIFFVVSSEVAEEPAVGVTLLLLLLLVPALLGGNRVFNGNRSSLTSSTTGILVRCFPPRDMTSFCSGIDDVDVPLLPDRSTVV